jgi:AAA domain
MIKRSVITGLLVGLVFTLVAIYPTLSFYLSPELLVRLQPMLRLVLMLLNGAVGFVVVVMVGSLAAWRSGAIGAGQGFKAGAISGVVVGMVFYALLLAPTVAAAASLRLWAHMPTPEAPNPPEPMIVELIRQMVLTGYVRMVVCILAGGLLGGLEGAFVGWLHRRRPSPRFSLLDVLAFPHPRRRWFAEHDDVWHAGIVGGLIGGLILWLATTVVFFTDLRDAWPAFQEAVQQHTGLLSRALLSDTLFTCLFPLFLMAVLGTGALTVLLLKDPPRRHLSRFQAVLISAVAATVPIFSAAIHASFFGLGMSRYLVWAITQQAQTTNPQGENFIDPQSLEVLRQFVHSPQAMLPFFYLVSFAVFGTVLVIVLAWLAPQAVFSGLTLPLVFRRPVDRAARVARVVNNVPFNLLPQLYRLFGNDAKAIQVLPHLAFLIKDRPAAEVVAAYHVLSTVPSETERAIDLIRQTVASQEKWRWRGEVSELYRILGEGLAAKTLAQVTAIQPLPREITSSLPLLLARSCEGIGRVLDELKKVERVDELSTKIIFLNSAQAALLDLSRATDQGNPTCQACATLYPEIAILHTLLNRWQGSVLAATQDLQGRADLQATLLTRRTSFAPRVRQGIIVSNRGLNVAQNVRLRVADGEGYQVVEGADQQVEILGPQESRELEFWLVPAGSRRLRLAWRLTYDDAVDIGREVEFADALELVQEEVDRPFQRIFPIPYVTGTPLRSSEMFVGRQDVFDFVHEHLLGTYQNNVIVLHGQRRTGKTSILYRLQDLLADTHMAVLVDMQGKAARGAADFLYALSDDIVYALENHHISVDLPPRADYEEAPEFAFRSRFLRSVVEALDSRNLLLMFDEFEELQKRVEDGRLEAEIFPFLRNLMQHEPRVDFLFSGTHKLEELGAEYWSILFNIAAYKRITFLTPEEVRRLVAEPVAPYGLEYDPLAVERIIQVTAGHPYFAQVVCHEMVAYHNETERSYLTVTCVDQVLERIVERGEAHFKYLWAGAAPDEQRVMLALADLLPDVDAASTPAQIAEELGRKGYDLSEDALARALAHLQAKDIVARSGPQSSLYRFKIDLIRRWIGITRPAVTVTG